MPQHGRSSNLHVNVTRPSKFFSMFVCDAAIVSGNINAVLPGSRHFLSTRANQKLEVIEERSAIRL